jgi:hypothetical protein
MKYFHPTTVLLFLLNAGLLVLVSFLWRDGERRVAEPAGLAVTPLEQPDLALLNSVPMPGVEVATIRDQAVFYVRRSFYRPPPPSMEVAPPEYVLSGTMGLQEGKRVAFVKRKSDQSSRTLHVGDDLDGWRVDRVETARVVLVHDTQTSEVVDTRAGGLTPGLLHGSASSPAASVVQTGPRVLGGVGGVGSAVGVGIGGIASGLSRPPVSSVSAQARTYRPPPSHQSPRPQS